MTFDCLQFVYIYSLLILLFNFNFSLKWTRNDFLWTNVDKFQTIKCQFCENSHFGVATSQISVRISNIEKKNELSANAIVRHHSLKNSGDSWAIQVAPGQTEFLQFWTGFNSFPQTYAILQRESVGAIKISYRLFCIPNARSFLYPSSLVKLTRNPATQNGRPCRSYQS